MTLSKITMRASPGTHQTQAVRGVDPTVDTEDGHIDGHRVRPGVGKDQVFQTTRRSASGDQP
jgi:hypothetical protein